MSKNINFLFMIGLLFIYSPSVCADDEKPAFSNQEEEFLRPMEKEPIGSLILYADPRSTVEVYLLKMSKEQGAIDSFNLSIEKNGLQGKISICRSVIEEPVRKSNGNISYGGVCLYTENQKHTPVKICTDEMVGHFKMIPITQEVLGYDSSIYELSKFVMENCFGG